MEHPGCVDSGTVAAWISGRLGSDDVARLEAHADGCPACLDVLAAIGRICADPHSHELAQSFGVPALADWVVLTSLPAAAVGRHRLDGILGRGGFGVVYLAHDLELDRAVAIKALLAAHGPAAAAAIRREARALATLSHPNVVQVYDVIEAGDRVYLVMELVRGETMRSWQARTPRSLRAIVERYLAAAAGLAAIHDAGLVHADVKPDNLLVADSRVLVSDFGLARALAADVEGIVGTPRYMAPEQRAGAPIDPRADQYAWCFALWEALHEAGPDEPARRTVSRRVRAVLRRGLERDRAARWPDMHTLAVALRDAIERPTSRWAMGAAAAALVVVAGAGIGLATASPAVPAAPDEVAAAVVVAETMPEIAAAIDRAAAQRHRGDLGGAFAALMPIIDGRTPASAPLRIRAEQELARALAPMGREAAARAYWTDAHALATAVHADLLAAEIAIDLAEFDGKYVDTLGSARDWLRSAETALRRVDVDPDGHAAMVLARATVMVTEGHLREGADAFARAAALPADADPTVAVRIRRGWADALGRLGEHEQGLLQIAEGHALCNAAALSGIERIELHRAAGTLLQNRGRMPEAAQQVQLALELADEVNGISAGHLSALHSDLGVFHLQLHNREPTEHHLRLALALAPRSWAAHANLAIHYGKVRCRTDVPTPGCDEDAAELGYAHHLRALELAREELGEAHPTFVRMQANHARELLERGELERALATYESACAALVDQYGRDSHHLLNPLYGLVEVDVRLGRRAEALAAAEQLSRVAHGPSLAGNDDATAVLDYVHGKTMAWNGVEPARAQALMTEARAHFGERRTDDFMLVDAWFDPTP